MVKRPAGTASATARGDSAELQGDDCRDFPQTLENAALCSGPMASGDDYFLGLLGTVNPGDAGKLRAQLTARGQDSTQIMVFLRYDRLVADKSRAASDSYSQKNLVAGVNYKIRSKPVCGSGIRSISGVHFDL